MAQALLLYNYPIYFGIKKMLSAYNHKAQLNFNLTTNQLNEIISQGTSRHIYDYRFDAITDMDEEVTIDELEMDKFYLCL